jgi:hypothetical protein
MEKFDDCSIAAIQRRVAFSTFFKLEDNATVTNGFLKRNFERLECTLGLGFEQALKFDFQ